MFRTCFRLASIKCLFTYNMRNHWFTKGYLPTKLHRLRLTYLSACFQTVPTYLPVYLSTFSPFTLFSHLYLSTYIPIYRLTFLTTFLPTYQPSLPTNQLHTCQPSIYQVTYLPSYRPYTCLPHYLPACIPSVHSQLHTCNCLELFNCKIHIKYPLYLPFLSS